ncbi:hypothetical protein SBRCBS47491_006579 [Sporothrix bragantina]|uniref:GH18 domain-containing protein n=1 Tax=Sporothrix bragantina TaxID=671064 RepID=A0ABP0C633_9PEZI
MLLPAPGVLGGAAAFAALLPVLGEAAKPPPPARLSFSPGYRGVDRLAGLHPGNWSLLRNLEQTNSCSETLFMGFSLYDGVDDASTYHRIFACTSFGADWTNMDAPRVDDEAGPGRSESPATDVLYQPGCDKESSGLVSCSRFASADIRSMSRQLRAYLSGGFRPANESMVLFAKSNQDTLGVYMGRGLDNAQTGEPALRLLEGALQQHNASSRVSVQLCLKGTGDRDHVFGVMHCRRGTTGRAFPRWSTYFTDTHISSAPGSAAPNTAGCISNCGMDIVQSAAPAQFRSVGYYEGYQFDRPCLFQDPKQIDTSRYTHIHYTFTTILANYSLSTGDDLATYAFRGFQSSRACSGVKAGNHEALAANIAHFATQHDLDRVDFDWEYPGAYDIPGIPPPVDGVDEGPDYLTFLQLVRQKLPSKSISIAVSSSY